MRGYRLDVSVDRAHSLLGLVQVVMHTGIGVGLRIQTVCIALIIYTGHPLFNIQPVYPSPTHTLMLYLLIS